MNAVPLMLGLLGCLLLSLLLWRWERRARRGMGLQGLDLVASDDSGAPVPTLRSEGVGLIGRPDHLARVGRAYVPVEVKPGATRLRDSHVLQLGAQCLLVEHTYGRRPPYGVAVLADGRREIVPYADALERRVLDTLSEMRLHLLAESAPQDAGSLAKCNACGFGGTCPSSKARRGRRGK